MGCGAEPTSTAGETMASITVIVATFGDPEWAETAERIALPSVAAQRDDLDELILTHGDTLHEARNAGAREATSEWLCFLDADDRLEPGYLQAMLATDEHHAAAQLLLYPAVAQPGRPPIIPTPRPSIWQGNWMVVGTLIRRDLFLECEGFWDEPAWEDWSLWIRAVELGAVPVYAEGAVYTAHTTPHGRNATIRNPYAVGRDIRNRNRQWLLARGWVDNGEADLWNGAEASRLESLA